MRANVPGDRGVHFRRSRPRAAIPIPLRVIHSVAVTIDIEIVDHLIFTSCGSSRALAPTRIEKERRKKCEQEAEVLGDFLHAKTYLSVKICI